mmetsp:Transcript_17030/g.33231  ORF Transcript_17030/g.33231 Transcript_17030/m.33231 type:complete len:437 (-) Transcript_17030:187-1497(-)|eukprot:CAMPEP_0175130512 /NCGR_PEP_ID=MMETSP0087-20121206/6046_1 /TAXON_ID=136419 /ORGANISM="Unknown Unknown, Strain D1" /LENGTH=436 /DNA_ID=CAMNT_0016412735 /DNA_START=37 /DNA_END=1347 /DNA_ORIENTATION=+
MDKKEESSSLSDSEVSDSEKEEETQGAVETKPESVQPSSEPASKPASEPESKEEPVPESARPQTARPEAATKDAKKEGGSTQNNNLCAVEGCQLSKFSRGYCSIHIITNQQNEIPEAPQRVRTTLNLWYRRESPDRGRIVWKFVHNGHRHEIVFYCERIGEPRKVRVDGKSIDCAGNYNKRNDWWLKFEMGRWLPFTCYLVQIYKGDNLLTDLVVDGRSFESRRDAFVKTICKEQVKAVNHFAGLDEKDISLHAAEQKHLKDNWAHEEYTEKTKRKNLKVVSVWTFTVGKDKHELVFEHGQLGGKKKVILDGKVIYEKKLSLLEPNSDCVLELADAIPGINLACCVVDLRRLRKYGLVAKDDNARKDTKHNFEYDLQLDRVPFHMASLSTFDIASREAPIPRPLDLGCSDQDLLTFMSSVKHEQDVSNPSHQKEFA